MTKPVFIIGCPRSGTTITLDLMSVHESFAWVSQLLNENPKELKLSSFNKIYDDPIHGKSLLLKRQQRKALPHPVEPWKFWDAYLSKFQWERGGVILPRRQDANDITPEEIKTIRFVVDEVCQQQKKGCFLSKYTDFPRIRYLTQAFPDATFIHIVRDGRAVAHSYYNEITKGTFHTWEERDWWVRGWPDSWRQEWRAKDPTPLGFVAYQWKFFVHEIWEDAHSVPPEQFLEVNYRDLIKSPMRVLKNIFAKCGLEMSARVGWYLGNLTLADMNSKWRE